MNEALKNFTKQLALDLKAKLGSAEMADFVKTVKESGDDRTFEVVFSTSDEDRQGDALDQSGWDFKYFLLNPVVLFAHDYSSFPIGIITDITVEGEKGIATGKFAPEGVNPAADMACALYQEKILRAVSPGYIQNDDGTRELLEVSFCPVPAGRYALSMRQVGKLGMSTQELVTKGFFFNDKTVISKTDKAQEAGDPCELEDGSPGVLSDGGDGKLVCVPREAKSKSDEPMNELEKTLKAEHERHGKCVGKAIDEFGKKGLNEDGSTKEDTKDAIDEFEKAMSDEQASHLDKCMKAIDEFGKKSIDEFTKGIQDEHLAHVKACDKAIDEFKDAWMDGDDSDRTKAIDEFTKAVGSELSRHEKAHMDMCKAEFGEGDDDGKSEKKKGAVSDEMVEDEKLQAKYKNLDRAYSVFYAFTSAYMDEAVEVDQFETLLDEAVALMKDVEAEVKGKLAKHYVAKSGRSISAANKEKLKAIIKAIEDHHTEHGKATDDVTAALKSFMDSGDGGEEPKPDEKSGAAPNSRSSTSGATAELETYLFTQRLVRQVKTAAEDALRQINKGLKESRSQGR